MTNSNWREALGAELSRCGYVLSAEQEIYLRPDEPGLVYSDGDEAESRLHAVLLSVADRSVMSPELRRHCIDWMTTYHLSSERSNVLRPFIAQLAGKRVLEIGAGCGAVTRFLGEAGAEVLALEGSRQRASIAALRCSGLDNVVVAADSLAALAVTRKFDAVLLVGVLEYARRYSNEPDPIADMLRHACAHLSAGGSLIVAIENQLGLKYLAGFVEDHTGQIMFGVEDRYQADGVVTFGRNELADRLARVGFSAQEWWYPFPDYKFPRLMLAERAVDSAQIERLTPLISATFLHDPQYPFATTFIPERAVRVVVRNRLIGHLANSFVVVAKTRPGERAHSGDLAIYYASGRRAPYAKQIQFVLDDGGVTLYQSRLYPGESATMDSGLHFELPERLPFLDGVTWHDALVDILTTPGWTLDSVVDWFQTWLNVISALAGMTVGSGGPIAGRYFDAIPRNLMITPDGEALFFDQEWILERDIAFTSLAIRALLSSLLGQGAVSEPEAGVTRQVVPLVIQILGRIGLELGDSEFEAYVQFENEVQNLVVGRPAFRYADLKQVRLRVSRTSEPQAEKDLAAQTVLLYWDQMNAAKAELNTTKGALLHVHQERDHATQERDHATQERDHATQERDHAIQERDQAIQEWEAAQSLLHTLVDSRSWKITAPLRKLAEHLRRP